jgi:predicted PurR-regulated permease PerM
VLAGIVGALLAVPVTAVGWTIIKTWSGRDDAETKAIDSEEGAAV